MPNFLIVITGPSGSGKSTLTAKIVEAFGEENVCQLPLDDYVKGIHFGCSLVKINSNHFDVINLHNLRLGRKNYAYALVGDQLYYLNKETGACALIPISAEELVRLKEHFPELTRDEKLTTCCIETLSSEQLGVIFEITRHKHCDQSVDEYFETRDFDNPNNYLFAQYVAHLQKLVAGEAVLSPERKKINSIYHRFDDRIEVAPAKIIITEGIFSLGNPSIKALVETNGISIFFKLPSGLALGRIVERPESFGLDEMQRFRKKVYPGYLKFIKPEKKKSDVIINGLSTDNIGEERPLDDLLSEALTAIVKKLPNELADELLLSDGISENLRESLKQKFAGEELK